MTHPKQPQGFYDRAILTRRFDRPDNIPESHNANYFQQKIINKYIVFLENNPKKYSAFLLTQKNRLQKFSLEEITDADCIEFLRGFTQGDKKLFEGYITFTHDRNFTGESIQEIKGFIFAYLRLKKEGKIT